MDGLKQRRNNSFDIWTRLSPPRWWILCCRSGSYSFKYLWTNPLFSYCLWVSMAGGYDHSRSRRCSAGFFNDVVDSGATHCRVRVRCGARGPLAVALGGFGSDLSKVIEGVFRLRSNKTSPARSIGMAKPLLYATTSGLFVGSCPAG